MRLACVFAMVMVLACDDGETVPAVGPFASAQARASAVARQLAEETTVKSRSGAALKAPRGWWLTDDGDLILLEDPDRALKAWLIESPEKDATRAIASAWERAAPAVRRELETDTPPPTGGWDAVTTVSYDVGRARVAEAVARRHGAITYVSLVDGARAAVSRRTAQLEQLRASLRPEGLREESFAGRTPRRMGAAQATELDAFVRDALSRLEVPGAVIAIVQGSAVVYERAFGLRALGRKEPVTPNTLFMIGSITKSMTTMMQATLVDAGVLDWEAPVTSVLPSFALGDSALTHKIAIWHMSCACTGMPRNDFEHIFEFEKVSPEARVASMKSMKPTTALGEAFQYSNLMFAAGGYVAAHADDPKASLGEAYDRAMRRRVFEPIGMKSTTLDFSAALRAEHALPHATAIDGVVRPIPVAMERNVISIRPAGGVWSSLRDMEHYVMTEMASGVAPNGKRVVTEKNLTFRRSVRTGDAITGGYGLGLDVGRFHGLTMIAHDGGAFGFGSSMFILPEQQIGIIVLTNVRNGAPTEYLPFNAVVKRRVFEALFEGARSLAAFQLDYFAKGKAKAVAKAVRQVELVPDRDRVKRLAGTYTNARLGELALKPTAAGATLDAGEWSGAVGQRVGADGTLALIFLDAPFPGGEFTVGGDEARPTLTVTDGQTTYVFARAGSLHGRRIE
jgi:CubicO group peptidase (beta-lactamase class C family)